jgi:hypothetical protein
MEIIREFQVAARKYAFIVVDECGDGTVVWLRRATPQATSGAHHRMCIDKLTSSATVYWTDVQGKVDSRTFRSMSTLEAWLTMALPEKIEPDNVALESPAQDGNNFPLEALHRRTDRVVRPKS